MPHNALAKLEELLSKTKRHQRNPRTHGNLVITEANSTASLKRIEIESVPVDALGFKHDDSKAVHDAFENGHPARRGCDAIIFVKVESKGYILFIELKSGKPDIKDVKEQLQAADCFVDHANKALRWFHAGSEMNNWERRYFIFFDESKNPGQKRPFKLNQPTNTTPDQARFIPVENGKKFYLKQLLAGEV